MLLFQAITSFEMRTRAGLYTGAGISGVILFLASQRALDLSFGIFLTGFTVLLLSLFAMSFLMDQARHADVRWFRSRFSFAWFWSGVLVVSLAVSVAIFLLLPKQFGDPVEGAKGVVLPMRASETVELPQVSPVASALPVITADQEETTIEESTQVPEESSLLAADSLETVQPSSDIPQAGGGSSASLSSAPGEGAASQSPDSQRSDGVVRYREDSLVMQVRSPVLTYWRGQVYDTFDGQRWIPDPSDRVSQEAGSGTALYRASRAIYVRGRPRYSQTFFARQAAPPQILFTGYAPLVASASFADDGSPRVSDGSVYRVLSTLPDFSPERLERADPRARLDIRYHELNQSLEGLRELAQQLTQWVHTDLERMRRIITYLDRNYEFDVSADDQLALSADPPAFLAQRSDGTSMDLATAAVLLGRAVGMPARLATGYLPRGFDALSGTYVVRTGDRHAWAELFLGRAGWVPFDSAPRLAAEAFGNG